MNSTAAGEEPEAFVFLLAPGVSMMSLASAIEPLRSLNRLISCKAYEWRLASPDGAPVLSSNEIPLPTVKCADAIVGARYLFLCGGLEVSRSEEKPYLSALRAAAQQGLAIGALSTGAHLLARAGLLENRRCTIHWESRQAFREAFPNTECTTRVYEIDGDRLTCAGGTAAMDLMLHLIGERFGAHLARAVANQFHHEHIRGADERQRGLHQQNLEHLPDLVREAVAVMERNIEDPVPLGGLADHLGLSARQVERLFRRHLGTPPLRYYVEMRLARARDLLIYSDMRLLDVAVASGFSSTAKLTGWYRRVYGRPPSAERRRPVAPE